MSKRNLSPVIEAAAEEYYPSEDELSARRHAKLKNQFHDLKQDQTGAFVLDEASAEVYAKLDGRDVKTRMQLLRGWLKKQGIVPSASPEKPLTTISIDAHQSKEGEMKPDELNDSFVAKVLESTANIPTSVLTDVHGKPLPRATKAAWMKEMEAAFGVDAAEKIQIIEQLDPAKQARIAETVIRNERPNYYKAKNNEVLR